MAGRHAHRYISGLIVALAADAQVRGEGPPDSGPHRDSLGHCGMPSAPAVVLFLPGTVLPIQTDTMRSHGGKRIAPI